MIGRSLGLGNRSTVMELASNDGYLLQLFRSEGNQGHRRWPAANVAAVAEKRESRRSSNSLVERSAKELVAQYGHVDLLIGNNVLGRRFPI